MKLQFEADLKYQSDAVDAVTDLFEGFSQESNDFSLTSEIIPNIAPSSFLDWDEVFNNYLEIYARNGIKTDYRPTQLEMDSGLPLDVGDARHVDDYPSFTVEMETGTGKGYCYFKTIYKLHKEYNFTKFLIVVPSRAIYEGAVKMYTSTKSHFASIFDKPNVEFYQYDGNADMVKSFAQSINLSIMLLTLDSFNKKTNKLFKETEALAGSGKLPYEFLAETRPILILDEPQNMTSEKSKQALRTLNPLFALHYSATHRELLNQVYRLTPFEAYRDGLVKKIQVYGFHEYEQLTFAELELINIDNKKNTATFRGYQDNNGFLQVTDKITLKTNQDIFTKTKNPHHRGLVIENINKREGSVELSNGETLYLARNVKKSKQEMFRTQLRETITAHIRRQDQLIPKGIKVLSLVFIDRVANYQDNDGIIRILFEQEFDALKSKSKFFSPLSAREIHGGYFAKKRDNKTGEDIYFDVFTQQEQKEAEKEAYKLIMRDKERLLSFEEKMCFVFAHSALKEGWDNPNVFQICTLSNTVSEIKKRQEIGRGLRLPVNQAGIRLKDLDENILTVVANESYESYVSGLQHEYEEAGELHKMKIINARKEPTKRNKHVFENIEFQAFWDKLIKQIHYKIDVKTDKLIKDAITYINEKVEFPEPRLVKQHGQFGINQITIKLEGFLKAGEKTRAKISVLLEDTTRHELTAKSYSVKIPEGVPFSHYISNAIFKAFIIKEINEEQGFIMLTDDKRIHVGNAEVYQFASHAKSERIPVKLEEINLPVPNFLEKISMELGLTRRTILEIFKGIYPVKKNTITKNPEGFINEFYKALKTIYADHIADYVTFFTHEMFIEKDSELVMTAIQIIKPRDEFLDELFPEEKPFAGTELIEGDERFIYDRVQIDSDLEKEFIEGRISSDPQVLIYFKFPGKFKLRLPSIIGNYNPDWGIVRKKPDGTKTLHLVRETKGREDVRKLRFDHEKRKIVCAKKYFETLGIDYRAISAQTANWWEKE